MRGKWPWVIGVYVLLWGPIALIMGLVVAREPGWGMALRAFGFPAVTAFGLWGIAVMSPYLGRFFLGYLVLLERLTTLPFPRWFGWFVADPKEREE